MHCVQFMLRAFSVINCTIDFCSVYKDLSIGYTTRYILYHKFTSTHFVISIYRHVGKLSTLFLYLSALRHSAVLLKRQFHGFKCQYPLFACIWANYTYIIVPVFWAIYTQSNKGIVFMRFPIRIITHSCKYSLFQFEPCFKTVAL